MAAADKAKLDGVAAGANNYAHPATHPATMITEDATHRFATDTEKSIWNAKASTTAATSTVAGLMSAADKAKLDGVATGANNYTHPNHTGDVTSTSDGVTAISAGVIVNADINSAAAIDASKIGTGVVSNEEFGYLDGVTSGIQGQLNAKAAISDYVRQPGYAVDTGAANVKVVALTPAPASYVDGMALSFKNAVLSTGPATINVNNLGAKGMVKSNGNELSSGNLKAGSIYTIRYNASTGNFILQGEGGEYRTASQAQVLSGYTIGTESGLTNGTIANNGAGGTVTPSSSTQTKSAGYYSSAITVSPVTFDASKVLAGTTIAGTNGTMVNRASQTTASSVGAANNNLYARIPLGGYMTAANGSNAEIVIPYSYVANNEATNLVPANIRSGVSYYGVAGTLTPWRTATATVVSSEYTYIPKSYGGAETPYIIVNTASIGFVPRIIIARSAEYSFGTICSDVLLVNYNVFAHNTLSYNNSGGGEAWRVAFNATSMTLPVGGNGGLTFYVTFYG